MTYRGVDRIIGGYLQLSHGRRYPVEVKRKRTGTYEVHVADGFAQTMLRYQTQEAFQREWLA